MAAVCRIRLREGLMFHDKTRGAQAIDCADSLQRMVQAGFAAGASAPMP